jgi:hypothetical protein
MTQFVHDHEAILNQFRAWLIETEEIDAPAERRPLKTLMRAMPVLQSQRSPCSASVSAGLLQIAEAFTAPRQNSRGTRELESMVNSHQWT